MRILTILTAALALSAAIPLATDAEARERHRSGSFEGPRGGGSFEHRSKRERGSFERGRSWETGRGSGSSDVSRRWDKESGTGEGQRTVTRADGKSAESHTTVTATGNGSAQSTTTRTGFGGQTSLTDRTLTKTDTGLLIDKTTTGPNGNAVSSSATLTKTDQGRETEGTYVTSGGASGSYSGSVVRGEGGSVKSQSLTTDAGKTWSRDIETTLNGDGTGGTKTVSRTPPDGDSESRSWSVTLDPDTP